MGIESDQLVYDYLSRVGDLAQQQQLPSGARMRLVSELRGEIDRQRGTDGGDSPAVVRRIIGRLGSPDELVAAAAEPGGGAAPVPSPRPPAGRGADTGASEVPRPRRGVFRKSAGRFGAAERVSGPEGTSEDAGGAEEPSFEGRPAKGPERVSPPPGGHASGRGGGGGARAGEGEEGAGSGPYDGLTDGEDHAEDPGAGGWPSASAPHMAGLDQAGPEDGEFEWWRIAPGPFGEEAGPGGVAGPGVAGFVGGLEHPGLLRPPRPAGGRADTEDGEPSGSGGPGDGDGEEERKEAAPRPARSLLRRTVRRARRRAPKAAPDAAPQARAPGFGSPLLLLSAVLLVAGAALGSWVAMACGWLLAFCSRRVSRTEMKWAALGLPGAVVAGALVWFWGRTEGRWGEPLAEDAMGGAMSDAWPVVLRAAAVVLALYLFWRTRRLPR
ncbi:hypothetical protein [Streptomyces nitrosporeus]|uniref:hypothetical protein n=1 Tax=Streptomyces nitrosporeus TaxID=28894 RepID=UPI00332C704A